MPDSPKIRVIVALDDRRLDAALIAELERTVGLTGAKSVGDALFTASIPSDRLDQLRALPFVREVEVSRAVRLQRR